VDAIPIAARATAANCQNSTVIFKRIELNSIVVQWSKRSQGHSAANRESRSYSAARPIFALTKRDRIRAKSRFNFMSQNVFPSGVHQLLQLAETIADALERHGPWLRRMEMDAAEFREALEVLRRSETAFATLRSEKAAAGKWVSTADQRMIDWLNKARLAVMLARGSKWSETWLDAGFVHQSTDVPKAIAPRIELARRVVDFFARNPQFGVAHANVTATFGRKAYDDAVGAVRVRRQLISECINAKKLRDEAERNLRRKMGQLVRMLGESIKPNDARWFAFGLNQPHNARWKERTTPIQAVAPITHLPEVRMPDEVSAVA
jgi:hypothetical protein